VFRNKTLTERQNRGKRLLGVHFLSPNHVFWAIFLGIISTRLACAGAHKIKCSKKCHKKCIFHLCVERPMEGGFLQNLKVYFYRRRCQMYTMSWYIAREVSVLWGVELSMLLQGSQAVLNTSIRSLPRSRWWFQKRPDVYRSTNRGTSMPLVFCRTSSREDTHLLRTVVFFVYGHQIRPAGLMPACRHANRSSVPLWPRPPQLVPLVTSRLFRS